MYNPCSRLTVKARPNANAMRDIECKISGWLDPRKPGADRIATGNEY